MKWFTNMSTRYKLTLLFSLMILVMTVISLIAGDAMKEVQQDMEELYSHEYTLASDTKDLRLHVEKMRTGLVAMLTINDRASQEAVYRGVQDETTKAEQVLQKLLRENTAKGSHAEDVVKALREIEGLMHAFIETREKEIVPLIFDGKVDQASRIAWGTQKERFNAYTTAMDQLVMLAIKLAEDEVLETRGDAARLINLLMVSVAATIALGIVLIIILSRQIAQPLGQIATTSQLLADGNLTVTIPCTDRRDEIGVLAITLERMVENFREINQEIKEGAAVLSRSTVEIQSSTAQIAAGASEAASAVNEITTTVEEVRQTAQLSNQKGMHVSESAREAAQQSLVGVKAVEEAVEGMNRIRGRMESIAETILALSEKTQQVGEITATVGALAQQSKMLALNASIEAAKAGEAGKGFAVVAAEVRDLAEQSQQATQQVQKILQDIRHATDRSVMATEEGSKEVDLGVHGIEKAGETVQKLAQVIRETELAGQQIVASVRQETAGIDQIGGAMKEINGAMRQFATATQQANQAAHDLGAVAANLQKCINTYTM